MQGASVFHEELPFGVVEDVVERGNAVVGETRRQRRRHIGRVGRHDDDAEHPPEQRQHPPSQKPRLVASA